jgi:hypothetical protein
MIVKGAEQLYSSVAMLEESLNKEDVQKAYNLKEKIVTTAKNYWESGKATRLKQEYMEEFTEVENELSFG